jgi:hypothetical protein
MIFKRDMVQSFRLEFAFDNDILLKLPTNTIQMSMLPADGYFEHLV